MRVIIIIVWLAAVAYGIPNLIAYDTIEMTEDSNPVAFCMNAANMRLHIMVLINFVLWYCLPLLLMSIMYAKISVVLWRSSFMTRNERPKADNQRPLMNGESNASTEDQHTAASKRLMQCTTKNALAGRRKVIRLLIAIVTSFAVCMLPHHVRLLYEMWTPASHPTFAHHLVPPFTFLFFYLNSALNPILYAFLSDNFRKRLKEVFGCGERQTGYLLKTGSFKSSRGAMSQQQTNQYICTSRCSAALNN